MQHHHRFTVALSFLAFLSLGLPDGSLGVAWPSIRGSFGVGLSALGPLLAVAIAGTLVSSAATGPLLERLGVGRLLVASTLLVTASAALMALSPSWRWALAGALLGGLGAGAVDAGVNAHAASSFAPRVVTWLHATYGAGAMLGPVLMTTALASGLGWRAGYATLAAMLAGLVLAFARNVDRWDAASPPTAATGDGPHGERLRSETETPPRPRILLGLLLFFVYTGLEAASGQWGYTFLTESRAVGEKTAGLAVAGYWGALGGGRLFFGALAMRLQASVLIRVGALGALASALLLAVAPGMAAAASLVALGFALAPVFPLSVATTPARVGAARAPRVIGWQVSAAYLGVAFWPFVGGLLAERLGIAILSVYLATLALAVLLVSATLAAGASVEPTGLPSLERSDARARG